MFQPNEVLVNEVDDLIMRNVDTILGYFHIPKRVIYSLFTFYSVVTLQIIKAGSKSRGAYFPRPTTRY